LDRIAAEAAKPAPVTGKYLHGQLEIEFGEQAPSLRTVQELFRQFQPGEDDEAWAFGQETPEDDALVLPVLAVVAEVRGYQIVSEKPIRQSAAQWVIRVRTAAPQIGAADALELALRFAAADRLGWDTQLLALGLALNAWDPAEEQRLVAAGSLPHDWKLVGPNKRDVK
jgi:hypothetical protein